MGEIALNIVQYVIMVIDGAAAAMLFSSFDETKQRWKTLSLAVAVLLFRLIILFLPINNYLVSVLMLLVLFAVSFFIRLTFPMRLFLTCCFMSAKEICLFTSLSPRTIVNNIAYAAINRMAIDEPPIPIADIKQYLDVGLAISEVISTIVYCVLLIAFLRYIAKSFIYKNTVMRKAETLYLILPCLSGIAVTQILRFVLLLPADTASAVLGNSFLTGFLIPATGILLLLSMAVSVRLYQNLKRLQAEEIGKKVLGKQITQIKEQVQNVQDVYADMRGIRHDMANHLSNIRLLMQTESDHHLELNGYIGKLEDTLETLRFEYQTGNPITDVIIHQKTLEARNTGIYLESNFLFPQSLDIDSFDIAVILSNALDNALEACTAMPEDNRRYVRLNAYQKGVMFFVEIENSFSGNILFDENTGLPVSVKPDRNSHGIGLANMRSCARKYFGDINITHGGGVFQLTVMLQGRV